MLTCRDACCCAIVPMSSCACVSGQIFCAREKVGAGSGTTKRCAERFWWQHSSSVGVNIVTASLRLQLWTNQTLYAVSGWSNPVSYISLRTGVSGIWASGSTVEAPHTAVAFSHNPAAPILGPSIDWYLAVRNLSHGSPKTYNELG